MRDLLIGVDVGTASARAGVLDARGALLGLAECAIPVRRDGAARAEQPSEAVWRAVCSAVRAAMAEAAAPPARVAAVGFDATCSLVARDAQGRPLGVGEPADGEVWDTILWLDHRAAAEAVEIGGADPTLAAVNGGAVSPEMQAPKLLWLKRRRPDLWARTGLLLDLVDFLTWRASGATARSACALACKWPWLGAWDPARLAAMGLADLPVRAGLPAAATPPGADLGPLTPAAAVALGVAAATRVAAGLVDAHAAALGMLGRDPTKGVALVAGTSTCVMAFRAGVEPRPGLWGPFPDAVLPGLSVVEGGQTAAGAALDHVLARFGGLTPDAAAHDAVAARIRALLAADGPDLARDLHVAPDFHGSRSPDAEPAARGAVVGLPLDAGFDGLCKLYWRTCVALAAGVREIVEAVADAPAARVTLHFGGGHARSPLLSDLYAGLIGATLVPHGAREPALRGAAATAAVAARLHPDLATAAAAVARPGAAIPPDPARARLHDRDVAAQRLLRDQRRALAAL